MPQLSSGLKWLAVGLIASGGGNYVYLSIAGQALTDSSYAPLGALWSLVFLVAPGLFFPVEQELSRAVAARRAHNDGFRPVVVQGFWITVIAAVVVGLIGLLLVGPISDGLFNGNRTMVLAFSVSVASFASMYFLRGLFAGSERLVAYGVLLSTEALLRCLVAGVLWACGVNSVTGYALALAFAPLVIMLFLIPTARRQLKPGSDSSKRELTTSLGSLVLAAVFSQALTNGAPLFAGMVFDSAHQDEAGAFIKAYLITRIPIFLFQAVQAAILPKPSSSVAISDLAGFEWLFKRFVIAVAVVGLAGGLFIVLLGDPLLAIFGTDDPSATRHLVILSVGNVFILVAMAAAQGLIALRKQDATVVGWGAGLAIFAVLLVLLDTPEQRLSQSLFAGALVSTGVMLAAVQLFLRRARSTSAG